MVISAYAECQWHAFAQYCLRAGGFLYVSFTLLPFSSACCSCVLSIASFSYLYESSPVYRTLFFFAIRLLLIHATPILFLFLLLSFAP